MICSSIPEAHLLLSWRNKEKTLLFKKRSCRLLTTAVAVVPPSPSAEPSRLWEPAPGRELRMTLGMWRPEPAPLPLSLWWRSSPAMPTRWHTTRRCRTLAGSGAGWAAQGADTGAGPGADPQPGRPGTACRDCGPAARHKPREAGGNEHIRNTVL